ncbi:SWFGD domain-containing protein [Sphingomonas sp. EC-HK361]|uniref:DUF2171 domain-containing protein n=1 Tax=Sphingomonas sp. EC-HK361 TaxID=2038397 RepID=UPI001255F6FB|nr:DUF2171 domain-containing protein [Sphingomonas sp. EC-HK361]VVS97065.1 SWFGD domain-containing protein [Sphingomonas sp. EC-HK361]
MGYERYPRQGGDRDYYGRRETQDYGRDYGSGGQYGASSAREYGAAGYGRGRDDEGRQGGQNDRGYGQRGQYGQDRSYGRDADRYGSYGGGTYRSGDYHGSYGADGRRFEDVGSRRDWDDDNRFDRDSGAGRFQGNRQRQYGSQPQGYDYDERGFFARAGDEVRSWFGDEDAERRRDMDSRYDDQYYANRSRDDRDDDYHSWRRTQIASLDRDYDEYRSENRTKFHNEFSTWRQGRQTQRDSLSSVSEHMDVVGSDGEHVGTVDKVRGDRILLTKSDADAGGRHHSIPSRWIDKVDTKVTLTKSAAEAQSAWRDEENNQAMFGDKQAGDRGSDDAQGRMLNRSFSGTY